MAIVVYSFKRHTISLFSGELDVPGNVIAKGDAAVREYIRRHEEHADERENFISECGDEIEDSMGYEVPG